MTDFLLLLLGSALYSILILMHRLRQEKTKNTRLLSCIEGILSESAGSTNHGDYVRVFAYGKPAHIAAIELLVKEGRVTNVQAAENVIYGRMELRAV